MTDRLLLDTHIALWFDGADDRLSTATRELLDDTWKNGGLICLSAVSAWEIALLVDTGRITLDTRPEAWVERFVDCAGFELVPLGHRAACRSYQLQHFAQRDPADRLIVATAIELGCPLVTYDRLIARFAAQHGRQYGFAVAV